MRYAILYFLVAGNLALGQTFTGTISGGVADSTGAVVAGVKLRAMNEDTGVERTEASNASGDYLFASLPPGKYRGEAALAGFKQESVRGVVLQVGQKVRIDLVLKPGDVSETVEVTGAAALINTSDAAVGQVIDQQKMVELPLNGRNFLQLALLSAGVEQRQTTRGLLAVNGTRGNGLGFLFDGVDGNDANAIFLSLTPSIEAIQEFKIQTSTYSAEFGRNAGGADQPGKPVRFEHVPWSAIPFHPELPPGREKLLPARRTIESAVQAKSVRRSAERPDTAQPDILPG